MSGMFVAGIQIFFGFVTGAILLIAGLWLFPAIYRSFGAFTRGRAGTFATVCWSLGLVSAVTLIVIAGNLLRAH